MAGPSWEYLVRQVGGALRRAKPDELTALLNEAAAEGWEPFLLTPQEGANSLLLVMRREATARTRRMANWPEAGG